MWPELVQGKSAVKPDSPAPLPGLILAHLQHREPRPHQYLVRASTPPPLPSSCCRGMEGRDVGPTPGHAGCWGW